MLYTLTIVLAVGFCSCFFGPAHAQTGEAMPERCAHDTSGRCVGDASAPPPGSGTSDVLRQVQSTQRWACQTNCNIVYSSCLGMSNDDHFKEDCNRKQVFCMKAC